MNGENRGFPPGTTWRDFAECKGLDYEMFFPSRGESTRAAKAICDSCYVKEECLEYAIERREPAGIWGMESTRERRETIKARKVSGEIEGRTPGMLQRAGGYMTFP